MILKPYYLECLSHASYLVVDPGSRSAAVVDPRRDVDVYVADADRLGATIRHVFLTHFHADFVSGHLELRARTGAAIRLGARAAAEYAFEPARDGDALDMGAVRFRWLETPGHTPESVSILLYDLERSAERPHAVFTGDTLFVGDVGRPDLMASSGHSAERLAGMLYDSLHGKLLTLPDETLVYPAHGAGSMCGRRLGEETVSTIGAQRRGNLALAPMSREAFVDLATRDLPPAPAYFAYDAELNRRARPLLEESLAKSLRPLAFEETLAAWRAGCQIVDARDPAEFARGHFVGSLNIPLSGRYALYAGMVLDRAQLVVVVAPPGRECEAALRLGRIGFDLVSGFLEGGAAAVPREWIRASSAIGAFELWQRLDGQDAPLLLDVRLPHEFRGSRIRDAANVPLHELPERLRELSPVRPVVLYCETGVRSSVALSLLERRGFERAAHLEGGIESWERMARGL